MLAEHLFEAFASGGLFVSSLRRGHREHPPVSETLTNAWSPRAASRPEHFAFQLEPAVGRRDHARSKNQRGNRRIKSASGLFRIALAPGGCARLTAQALREHKPARFRKNYGAKMMRRSLCG